MGSHILMSSSIVEKAAQTWQLLNRVLGGWWNRSYLPQTPLLAIMAPPPVENSTSQEKEEVR